MPLIFALIYSHINIMKTSVSVQLQLPRPRYFPMKTRRADTAHQRHDSTQVKSAVGASPKPPVPAKCKTPRDPKGGSGVVSHFPSPSSISPTRSDPRRRYDRIENCRVVVPRKATSRQGRKSNYQISTTGKKTRNNMLIFQSQPSGGRKPAKKPVSSTNKSLFSAERISIHLTHTPSPAAITSAEVLPSTKTLELARPAGLRGSDRTDSPNLQSDSSSSPEKSSVYVPQGYSRVRVMVRVRPLNKMETVSSAPDNWGSRCSPTTWAISACKSRGTTR